MRRPLSGLTRRAFFNELVMSYPAIVIMEIGCYLQIPDGCSNTKLSLQIHHSSCLSRLRVAFTNILFSHDLFCFGDPGLLFDASSIIDGPCTDDILEKLTRLFHSGICQEAFC